MIKLGVTMPVECSECGRLRIPWAMIAPHDAQAQANHGGQDLFRLAQRGGLSPLEAIAILLDRKLNQVPPIWDKKRDFQLLQTMIVNWMAENFPT